MCETLLGEFIGCCQGHMQCSSVAVQVPAHYLGFSSFADDDDEASALFL
jgi:hypothetical protein